MIFSTSCADAAPASTINAADKMSGRASLTTVTTCPVAVSRLATRPASSLVLKPLPCACATQVISGENFLSHIGRPSITLQILYVIHFFLFSATIAAAALINVATEATLDALNASDGLAPAPT